MTRPLTVLLAVATTASSVAFAPAAETAQPVDEKRAKTVRIHPGKLAKVAPTTHARLVGTTIRDGRFRKRVRVLRGSDAVSMHGKAHKGYVVTGYRKGQRVRLWYVPRRGPAKRLRLGKFDLYQISPSGRYAAVTNIRGKRDRLRVRTIPGDRTIAKRTAGWIEVLDMRGSRALLDISSNRRERVAWLRPKTNTLRPVVRRAGWFASVRHNRLLTDEPVAKGGFAMVRLDKPNKVLWRRGLRGEAPVSISPDGRYLQDFIWRWRNDIPVKPIGVLLRRTSDGKVVRRFRANRIGWNLTWTGRHTFLIAAAGRSKTSMVRCRPGGRCVRFGRLVRTRKGVSPEETLGVSLASRQAVASRAAGARIRGRGLPSPPTS